MRIIVTGATGMIGEGVLLTALNNPDVTSILMVNRRPSAIRHPKLSELIVKDFTSLSAFTTQLTGYDGCFYCAGISSFGMSENKYSQITFYTTMIFAKKLADLNPEMVFFYLSGVYADSSEVGKIMWARVKGKAENNLNNLPFKASYSIRPGFIIPMEQQKNVRLIYKSLKFIYPFLFPNKTLVYTELVSAMLKALKAGYQNSILEIEDIKRIANY